MTNTTIKMTLRLPRFVRYASRGVEFEFDLEKVPEAKREIIAVNAFAAGISKTGNDATSNAVAVAKESGISVEEATKNLGESKLAVWYSGEWLAKGGGKAAFWPSKEHEQAAVRAVASAIGADKWKGLKAAERKMRAKAYFEGLDDAGRKQLDAAAETIRKVQAEMEAALAGIELPEVDVKAK